MPLVTAFNLRHGDRLDDIETAVREALAGLPDQKINDYEVDFVPVLKPDGFHGTITRINIDLWERRERTKEGLQELAGRVAKAFQRVTGADRKVKVVIRPYAIEKSGWVSF
jgi:phenylpyruvate tautomerase PptA (4-oxalocrotonate tautomerase family)